MQLLSHFAEIPILTLLLQKINRKLIKLALVDHSVSKVSRNLQEKLHSGLLAL